MRSSQLRGFQVKSVFILKLSCLVYLLLVQNIVKWKNYVVLGSVTLYQGITIVVVPICGLGSNQDVKTQNLSTNDNAIFSLFLNIFLVYLSYKLKKMLTN